MNEPSNFCNYPCSDPIAEAAASGNPPRPPPIRLGSDIPLPGLPQDFQPQCHASITFNVEAETFFGENIVVLGDVLTLGQGNIWNAASLGADDYPTWSATIDVEPNQEITYSYVRAEPGQTYVYEDTNRTITVGDCGSTYETNDTITTESPDTASTAKRDAMPVEQLSRSIFRVRQSGDMLGLPGRNLIDPPYEINNEAGSLSNRTALTSLIHSGDTQSTILTICMEL